MDDGVVGDGVVGDGVRIGTLLRIPSSVVAEATERGLAVTGYGDVRAAHLPVLQPLFMRPEGARITDLAAWAHITKPSMVYLVNYLEAAHYVVRTADAKDGRAQRVCLTEQGVAAIVRVREIVEQVEADWAARIGTARLADLKSTLRLLIASLGEPDGT